MAYKPQVLAVADGGTGVSTLTGIPLGSGTSAFSELDHTPASSFTPSITFGGGTTGMTYNYRVGYYSRIDTMIFIQAVIEFTSKGSSVGGAEFVYPVAGKNISNLIQLMPCIIQNTNFGTKTFNCYSNVYPAATSCGIFGNIDYTSTSVQMTDTNFTNTSIFQISGVYFAD